MLLPLIQWLLLCSFAVVAEMPVAFVGFACDYAATGKHGRAAVVTGLFVLGALMGGLLAWQRLPSEWALSFWTTLQAAADVTPRLTRG